MQNSRESNSSDCRPWEWKRFRSRFAKFVYVFVLFKQIISLGIGKEVRMVRTNKTKNTIINVTNKNESNKKQQINSKTQLKTPTFLFLLQALHSIYLRVYFWCGNPGKSAQNIIDKKVPFHLLAKFSCCKISDKYTCLAK